MQYLDKLGWPVERVKGRWFFNFIRLLIHTRKIKRGSFITQEWLTSPSSRPQEAGAEAESKNDGYKELFDVLAKGRSKPPPA